MKFYQEYAKEMKLIPFDKSKYGDRPKIFEEYVKRIWGHRLVNPGFRVDLLWI